MVPLARDKGPKIIVCNRLAASRVDRAELRLEANIRFRRLDADLHAALVVDLITQNYAGVVRFHPDPGLQSPRRRPQQGKVQVQVKALGLRHIDADPVLVSRLKRRFDHADVQTTRRGELPGLRVLVVVRHTVPGTGRVLGIFRMLGIRGIHLVVVIDPVIVRVAASGMGMEDVLFFAVGEGIAIGVVERVQDTVAVRIDLERVGAGKVLVQIGEAVTVVVFITISMAGIGPVGQLPEVGHAVTVGIHSPEHRASLERIGSALGNGVSPAGQPIHAPREVFVALAAVVEQEGMNQTAVIGPKRKVGEHDPVGGGTRQVGPGQPVGDTFFVGIADVPGRTHGAPDHDIVNAALERRIEDIAVLGQSRTDGNTRTTFDVGRRIVHNSGQRVLKVSIHVQGQGPRAPRESPGDVRPGRAVSHHMTGRGQDPGFALSRLEADVRFGIVIEPDLEIDGVVIIVTLVRIRLVHAGLVVTAHGTANDDPVRRQLVRPDPRLNRPVTQGMLVLEPGIDLGDHEELVAAHEILIVAQVEIATNLRRPAVGRVPAAVDLVAVLDTVVVRVQQVGHRIRIASGRDLDAVHEAVGIGVLFTVRNAIAVGVVVERVGVGEELGPVDQAVAIGILIIAPLGNAVEALLPEMPDRGPVDAIHVNAIIALLPGTKPGETRGVIIEVPVADQPREPLNVALLVDLADAVDKDLAPEIEGEERRGRVVVIETNGQAVAPWLQGMDHAQPVNQVQRHGGTGILVAIVVPWYADLAQIATHSFRIQVYPETVVSTGSTDGTAVMELKDRTVNLV